MRIDANSLDTIFAPFASDSEPGLAVGIALNGEPVYRKAFGVASVELPIPLTAGMRMRIGSVSKHFSALALLQLIEEGRTTLDTPVRSYISALPRYAEAVTLRHLMEHTSGLRCGLDILLSMAGIGVTMPGDAAIDAMTRQEAVQFRAGTNWSYNNGGYSLIGAVIEQLCDRPLGEVLRERLFQPLGMSDTTLRPLDTDLVRNSATLHMVSSTGSWVRGVFGVPMGAEGGIVSTIDDMLRWLANMRTPIVGSAESWAAMTRSAVLESGHRTGYGFGLVLDEWRGHRLIYHAGGVIGGSAQMMTLPDLGLDVILIANRAAIDLTQIARDVLAACSVAENGRSEKPTIPIHAAVPVEGAFRSPRTGMVIELAAQQGRQTLSLMGAALPARFRPDGIIALEVDYGRAIRVPTGDIAPVSIDYHGLGGCETLERIMRPNRDDQSLLGDYESAEAQARIHVIESQDGMHLETRSRYGAMTYRLRQLGVGLWSFAPLGLALPFGGIIEQDGDTLRFSTRRARGLRFERQR